MSSTVLESALAARWKQRVILQMSKASQRDSLVGAAVAFPRPRGSRIQGGSEESVAPRLRTCLCSTQGFCQEHTCLQAASLGDSLQKGATRPGTEGLRCPLAVPLNDGFNKKVQ